MMLSFTVFIGCLVTKFVMPSTVWECDSNIKNYISDTGLLYKTSARTQISCAQQCDQESKCVSFFYTRPTRTCQLTSHLFPHGAPINTTRFSNGTKFYYKRRQIPNFTYFDTVRKNIRVSQTPSVTKEFAEKQCSYYHGTLIVMKNLMELAPIEDILKQVVSGEIKQKAFWVGAEYNSGSSEFQWSDGTPLLRGSHMWADNQPEYFSTTSPIARGACVIVLPALLYKLDDFKCAVDPPLRIYAICQSL